MDILATGSIFFLATLLMTVFYHIRYVNQYPDKKPLDYRAISDGQWNDLRIWEVSDGNEWYRAEQSPNGNNVTVFINKGLKIKLNQDITLNNLFIEEGAELEMKAGTVQIVKSFDQGILACNGIMNLGESEIKGDGDLVIGAGSSLYCKMHAGNSVSNFRVTGSKSINNSVRFFTF